VNRGAIAVDTEAFRQPATEGNRRGPGGELWLASIDKRIAKLDAQEARREERKKRFEARIEQHAAVMRETSRRPERVLLSLVGIPKSVKAAAEKIRIQVEREFDVRIIEHNRARFVSRARSVAWYLARRTTGMSYPQIGRLFGGFHHTSVMYAIGTLTEEMEVDPGLRRQVEKLGGPLSDYDPLKPDESGVWAI
jgi:chromosomal replication initiation ATPase DnaA